MICVPIVLVLLAAEPLGPGDHFRRLQMDGQNRSYWVHVPPQYQATTPLPLVLAFHGAGMNGKLMSQWSGLNETADKKGFLVAYPNGTGIANLFLTFNVGQGGADETKFVPALLDDMATVLNLDPRRVYAAGYSNGGMLCYLLAARMADRIAAIAPVAAIMTIDDPRPSRPVPVLHFHGTDDKWVPWELSKDVPKSVKLTSVSDTVQSWAKLDDCPLEPAITDLPDQQDDGTSVQRHVYGPGKEGSQVVLYVIRGGGHTWPGQKPALELLGRSTREISANELLWDFFRQYQLPPVTDAK